MSAIEKQEAADVLPEWTDEAEQKQAIAISGRPEWERASARVWLSDNGFCCLLEDRPKDQVIPFGQGASDVLAGKETENQKPLTGESINSPKSEIHSISAMLLDDALIAVARSVGLTTLHFYNATRARLYQTILNLDEQKHRVSYATVEAELRRQGMTEHAATEAMKAIIVGPLREDAFRDHCSRIIGDSCQRDAARAAAIVIKETSGGRRITSEILGVVTDLLRKAERANATEWERPDDTVLEKAMPFPMDVFPRPMREFIREVAQSIPCPVDFVAVPCLSVASTALGRAMSLQIKPGWHEEANIWSAIVGEPGSAKTPAIKKALQPLFNIMDEELEQHQLLKRHAQEAKRQLQAESRKHGAKLPEMLEQAANVPPLRRTLLSDATCEAIGPRLVDNPRGLLLAADELAGWLNGMNQYKSGGNDRQFFLQLWSRSAVIVDRKGQDGGIPIYAGNPYLSITGGIQPSKLDLVNTGVDDGFMDRMLLSYPEPLEIQFSRSGVHCQKVWDSAVRRLWNIDLVDNDNGKMPLHAHAHCLHFSEAAYEQYVDFFNRNAKETKSPDFPRAKLGGHFTKLRQYCARLSLLMEMLAWAFDDAKPEKLPEAVEASSVQSAEKLVAYFASHYLRVISLAAGVEADNQDARDILEWVQHRSEKGKGSRFTLRQVTDNFKRRFGSDPKGLEKAMSWLVRKEFVREIEPPRTSSSAVKRSPVYEVNPTVFPS